MYSISFSHCLRLSITDTISSATVHSQQIINALIFSLSDDSHTSPKIPAEEQEGKDETSETMEEGGFIQ